MNTETEVKRAEIPLYLRAASNAFWLVFGMVFIQTGSDWKQWILPVSWFAIYLVELLPMKYHPFRQREVDPGYCARATIAGLAVTAASAVLVGSFVPDQLRRFVILGIGFYSFILLLVAIRRLNYPKTTA